MQKKKYSWWIGIIFCASVLALSYSLFMEVIIFDILPTEKVNGIIERSNLNEALEGNYYECLVRYEFDGNKKYATLILGVNENRKYLIGDSVNLIISKNDPEKVSQGGSSLRVLKLLGVITLVVFAIWFIISKR